MKIIEYRPFASNTSKPFAFGPKVSNFLPSRSVTTDIVPFAPTDSVAFFSSLNSASRSRYISNPRRDDHWNGGERAGEERGSTGQRVESSRDDLAD